MLNKVDHISICICTYKRPALLKRLLAALTTQETEDLFEYSAVIVDNDRNESARQVAESAMAEFRMAVKYCVEPEQNIALARNRAVTEAAGDFLALIDDDEFPDKYWLLSLYKSLHEHKADSALGPVRPHFETEPPRWIVVGKFCERQAFQTGTIIRNAKHTRTGNVLFIRNIFAEKERWFDPLFGRTGGEDVDFFKRKMLQGKIFVWCNEAFVNESVPLERLTRAYFLRRAILRGVANSEKISILSFNTLKSIMAIFLYTAMLPLLLLLVWRHDLFMRFLIRNCDHIGKVLALCGLKVVNQR